MNGEWQCFPKEYAIYKAKRTRRRHVCRAGAQERLQGVDGRLPLGAGDAADDGEHVRTAHLPDRTAAHEHDAERFVLGYVELVETLLDVVRGLLPACATKFVADEGMEGAVVADLLDQHVAELVAACVGELRPVAARDETREACIVVTFRVDREHDVDVGGTENISALGVDKHDELHLKGRLSLP